MMRYFFGLLIFFSFFYACKPKEKIVENTALSISKEDYISIYRGACYGNCPVYKLTINGDGSFVFFGKSNVSKLGAYKGTISAEQRDNLFNQLQKYPWTSYPDEFPIDNVDFPQFTIEYKQGTTYKKVKANSSSAAELVQLVINFDKLLETLTLEKLD